MHRINSVFDPSFQHGDVRAKLVTSVEKVSQGFRSLLWRKATSQGLSPIQIQLVVYLRFHDGVDCRVGNLASQFDLTVATISGVLSTLVEKDLITKELDPTDRRARILRLTDHGSDTADRLAGWADSVIAQLSGFSEEECISVMRFMMELIEKFQKNGIVTVARMCLTCSHLREAHQPDSKAPHYCALLGVSLHDRDLRIDCPEHMTVNPA